MTREEAREAAIRAGALEPQGMGEQVACNLKKSENWWFDWSTTPRAQGRLEAWTNAVLAGVPTYELKRRVG
jgi:hypothetical protein